MEKNRKTGVFIKKFIPLLYSLRMNFTNLMIAWLNCIMKNNENLK